MAQVAEEERDCPVWRCGQFLAPARTLMQQTGLSVVKSEAAPSLPRGTPNSVRYLRVRTQCEQGDHDSDGMHTSWLHAS
jgi:hypothetical protein